MESPPFMKNKEKEWGSWREGGKKKKREKERNEQSIIHLSIYPEPEISLLVLTVLTYEFVNSKNIAFKFSDFILFLALTVSLKSLTIWIKS